MGVEGVYDRGMGEKEDVGLHVINVYQQPSGPGTTPLFFPHTSFFSPHLPLTPPLLPRANVIVSNATRWDTFERLLACNPTPTSPPSATPAAATPARPMPEGEALFRGRYQPSPSFISIHMGVRADLLPEGTECHHIIVEDWEEMEKPRGTLFVSIPTLLDASLAPEGTHIIHYFTPDWIEDWQVCVWGGGGEQGVCVCVEGGTDIVACS